MFFAIPFPQIDPIMIEVGPLAIHWYGVAYVAGILLGWMYARSLVSNERLWGGKAPFGVLDMDDFLMWAVAGIILGGRTGYVLFYDLAQFIAEPLQIFMLWTGGMSFHGGLIGTIIAMMLFARRRGYPVLSLFDVVAASAGFGIFFGRVANFINQELWGKPTTVEWGVIFPAAGPEPRHPSQLYEALLEGAVMVVLLRVLTHGFLKLKTPGFVGGAFIAWYAVARIFVEFFRLPDAQIGYLYGGWLTMGMVLSLPMLALGIWAMWHSSRAARLQSRA
jgi:phosphatidylglycerol:prolipoprotein diacylglycerol transferase